MTINSEAEYRSAMREIETLMNAEADTPEGKRLNDLVEAVQSYEAIYHDDLGQ